MTAPAPQNPKPKRQPKRRKNRTATPPEGPNVPVPPPEVLLEKPPVLPRPAKRSKRNNPRLAKKDANVSADSRAVTVPEVSTPSCTSGVNRDSLNCPICIEKFDELELRFYPCPCGYRVCAMCIHLIKEKADGKCPNCREDYDQDRGRVSDAIEKELLVILQEVQEEKNKENMTVRPVIKSRPKPRKSPGSKPKRLPEIVPIDVVPPPPPPPPVPKVRLTRYTGGLSVWD